MPIFFVDKTRRAVDEHKHRKRDNFRRISFQLVLTFVCHMNDFEWKKNFRDGNLDQIDWIELNWIELNSTQLN